jgi:hypothetical protein
MRWVLITALGMPIEPEVNRNLPMVSGPTCAAAASTALVGTVARSSAKEVAGRPAGGSAVTTISVSGGRAASIAARYAAPQAAKTRPGVTRSMMYRSLPKSCETSE